MVNFRLYRFYLDRERKKKKGLKTANSIICLEYLPSLSLSFLFWKKGCLAAPVSGAWWENLMRNQFEGVGMWLENISTFTLLPSQSHGFAILPDPIAHQEHRWDISRDERRCWCFILSLHWAGELCVPSSLFLLPESLWRSSMERPHFFSSPKRHQRLSRMRIKLPDSRVDDAYSEAPLKGNEHWQGWLGLVETGW